jgi:hypothetical protein
MLHTFDFPSNFILPPENAVRQIDLLSIEFRKPIVLPNLSKVEKIRGSGFSDRENPVRAFSSA